MATTEPESQSPQNKVERTFELLAAAKKLKSESSYWLATEKFVEAHRLLTALAGEEREKAAAAAATAAVSKELENTHNIAKLYASKADEYWKQSRLCLIQAMEHEKTYDEEIEAQLELGIETEIEITPYDAKEEERCRELSISNNWGPPTRFCALLKDDRARARNRSFSFLFSRILSIEELEPSDNSAVAQAPESTVLQEQPQKDENENENKDVKEPIADELDLEARLRSLNQSLPSGFKTVDERMSDVNKGLGDLGVSSVYTEPLSQQRRFEDELPKTEDEQIDEILAQAQDEAIVDRMNRGDGDGNGDGDGVGDTPNNGNRKTYADGDGDGDSSGVDSESESGDSEEDALLDNDQLAMKTIQKQLVKAQVKLAELLALVDQARSKRAKEDRDEEEEIFKNNDADADSDSDDDSFREVQKNDVAFLMMTGKKKLKSAQRDMRKAMAEWEDMIL